MSFTSKGKGALGPSVTAVREFAQREFERQQPIINELVMRFEKLQNKRESFRAAASKPVLPKPESVSSPLSPPKHLVKPSKIFEIDVPIDLGSRKEAPVAERKKTKPIINMESALMDSKLRGHFRDFVEAAFAVENLDFYEATEKYSLLGNDKERVSHAKRIVDEYVRETSPNQVNLPSGLASKLVKAVDAGEDATKLLEQAKHEILNLMQTNFFDKFLSVVGQPAYVPDNDDEEEKEDDPGSSKKSFFKDWIKRVHPKTGDTFYENPQTGVTMWDVPKPMKMPPPLEPPPYF